MARSMDESDTRCADAAALAVALVASRHDTLASFAALVQALPGLSVPQRETLNPPLWELGHIGWFQEFWLARNPQRAAGAAADPDAQRWPGLRAQADALYDSSRVPHANRWALPLPDAEATRDDLACQLQGTLGLLSEAGPSDDALYFFRLALFHEDMHHEAALYMAQSLGVAVSDPRWQAAPVAQERRQLNAAAGAWTLGEPGPGFAFDNELGPHRVELAASKIDSRVLSWADYLPFVEAGGYRQPEHWGEAGARWLARERLTAPRYLRLDGDLWQHSRHGEWQALELSHAACHLSAFEAEAWCAWAGRRLPGEAEWERAAIQQAQAFNWGQVWEWTASAFAPYPGFTPHPYRDYSAPWFGSRRVLRGASFMTQPRLRCARYRNFFAPDRNDVPAGFRSCAR